MLLNNVFQVLTMLKPFQDDIDEGRFSLCCVNQNHCLFLAWLHFGSLHCNASRSFVVCYIFKAML